MPLKSEKLSFCGLVGGTLITKPFINLMLLIPCCHNPNPLKIITHPSVLNLGGIYEISHHWSNREHTLCFLLKLLLKSWITKRGKTDSVSWVVLSLKFHFMLVCVCVYVGIFPFLRPLYSSKVEAKKLKLN